jgi:hypothetical protein
VNAEVERRAAQPAGMRKDVPKDLTQGNDTQSTPNL